MKNKLALVIAVALGLVATWGFLSVWKSREREVEQKLDLVKVVAAATRIRAGTQITADMLTLIDWPKANVSGEYVLAGSADALYGQTLVRPVERNEPLLHSYFQRPEMKLSDQLAGNERALAVRVDAVTGVAGNLTPGARVDVVGTFPAGAWAPGSRQSTGGTASEANQSVALLSNVIILAVDNRTRESDYTMMSGMGRNQSYGTVTLAVTPEEAVLLVFCQQYGTLTLTLRPNADTTTTGVQTTVSEKNLIETVGRVQADRQERMRKRPPMVPVPLMNP